MQSDKTQIATWEDEDHPSTELLQQYEDGVLPEKLNHRLEKHLLDCELCSDLLEGMSLTERVRTRQNVHKLGYRIKARLRKHRKRATLLHGLSDWRVTIAIIMMFCSLGLILFFHYTKQQMEPVQEEEPVFEEVIYPVTEFELVLPERTDGPFESRTDSLQLNR